MSRAHLTHTKSRDYLYFIIFGCLAVIVGGAYPAFLAKTPSEFAMWSSAFVVLIMGVVQIALGLVMYAYGHAISTRLAVGSWLLYNLACLMIITGTGLKTTFHQFVPIGSVLFAVSVLLHVMVMRSAKKSLGMTVYYATVALVLLSMPLGLLMSYS